MPTRSRIAVGVACLFALSSVPSHATQTDPYEARQWALQAMQVPTAWKTTQGKGVVVALLHSGVQANHPDLRGRLRLGPDLVHPGAHMVDGGMGTYFASLIAAGRNGTGVVGVAPQATVLVVKTVESSAGLSGVGASSGAGDVNAAAAGVRYAVSHGARVIALTAAPHLILDVGGTPDAMAALEGELEVAIWQAATKGVAVVVPAGDSAQPNCPPYLMSLPQVLCVGAVDRRLNHAVYSAVDAQQEQRLVVAPGGAGAGYYMDDLAHAFYPMSEVDPTDEDVLGDEQTGASGDYNDDGVVSYASTSVAVAHVSGVLALLIARGYSPTAAVSRVLKTTRDLGPAGRDPVYGYGMVDAAAAVR